MSSVCFPLSLSLNFVTAQCLVSFRSFRCPPRSTCSVIDGTVPSKKAHTHTPSSLLCLSFACSTRPHRCQDLWSHRRRRASRNAAPLLIPIADHVRQRNAWWFATETLTLRAVKKCAPARLSSEKPLEVIVIEDDSDGPPYNGLLQVKEKLEEIEGRNVCAAHCLLFFFLLFYFVVLLAWIIFWTGIFLHK